MNIAIIGDSYGLGEFDKHERKPIPDTGLDHYLRNLGYDVTNYSKSGASCFGQLRNFRWTQKEKYDYTIWFHTDPYRDILEIILSDPEEGKKIYPDFYQNKSFNSAMEYIHRVNYQYAEKEIFNKTKTPFICIGGCGKIPEYITDYNFAKHVIHSWIEELVPGLDAPDNFFTSQGVYRVVKLFEKSDKEGVANALDRGFAMQDLCKQSKKFPDNIHVCREEYRDLASRIHTLCQK